MFFPPGYKTIYIQSDRYDHPPSRKNVGKKGDASVSRFLTTYSFLLHDPLRLYLLNSNMCTISYCKVL